MPKLIFYSVATAGLAFFTACRPPDMSTIENEVNDLKVEVNRQRKEIQDLNRKMDQEGKAATEERAQNAQLRADLYEFMRQQKVSSQQLANRQGNSTQPQTSRPAARPGPTIDAASPLELPPAQQQLALANKDYNAGNNAGAVELADNLIKYFPDDPNVPEALYLKGKALMAMKSYRGAQDSFQKIIDSYPEYSQFRAALLNVGICQVNQGNTMAAVSTLQTIIRRYPSSDEARRASEIVENVKTGK